MQSISGECKPSPAFAESLIYHSVIELVNSPQGIGLRRLALANVECADPIKWIGIRPQYQDLVNSLAPTKGASLTGYWAKK
uniref:Uncharacterized protein n=1 Tax=Shewanella decolorationis TaxID=256839 RepID=A0A5B8R330_9GAMM